MNKLLLTILTTATLAVAVALGAVAVAISRRRRRPSRTDDGLDSHRRGRMSLYRRFS